MSGGAEKSPNSVSARVLLFGLLASAMMPTTMARGVANPLVSLSVTYFDCPKNLYGHSQPRLVVFNLRGAVVLRRSWPRISAVPSRTLTVSLRPGFYEAVVANGDCGDDLSIPLLTGHSRHVIGYGRSEALLVGNLGMVAGTLPSLGWQVAIVYRGRKPEVGQSSSPDGFLQYPAVVEGNAYYATLLPDGVATIRLYNQGRFRWLDFNGGRIESASGVSALTRNITATDISAKLRSLAHMKPICVPAKMPGTTICTPPT